MNGELTILLTGANGFLGKSLAYRLAENNVKVIAMVRSESSSLPGNVNMIVQSLEQIDSLDRAIIKSVNVVIHTAARAHVMNDESMDPMLEYRKVNCDATLALARLAAESGVKRFVFISSVKVNGEGTDNNRFTSEIERVPEDPYGLSKFDAEQGLLDISKKTGMEVVIIRPPLVYGPGVKGNFASMVHWVKKGVPLPLGAVNNKRSLVALDNLVDFIALCADRSRSPKAANEIFLISDDQDVSTSDLLRKVATAYGVASRLLPIPSWLLKLTAGILGKGAVIDRLIGNLQVDSSKARELLGWKPVVTMDEQLAKMVAEDMKVN